MTSPPTPRRLPPAMVRATRWFSTSLAVAVVATLLPLPWTLAGLPAAIMAGVFAVVVLFRSRGNQAPGLLILTSLGLMVAGFLATMFAAEALFYREFSAYETCQSEAITVSSTAACQKNLEDAVTARIRGWQNAILPSPRPSASSSSASG